LTDTFASGRLLIVAFEGWNDAGEAASNAVRALRDDLGVEPIADVEAEDYFDFQFNRPTVRTDEDGNRVLEWPSVTMYGPESDEGRTFLLLGTEPSRGWRTFCDEILEVVTAREITGIVMLGAMLADVPHTRPISIFASSESPVLRSELGLDRSSYEGPVGILSVLAEAAQRLGIPSISIWASVPHYVHNAPSPKATLAILDKLEGLLSLKVPRGDLQEEAAAWESGIDALASDDDDMSTYIEQLERARDTVDSPEASGEAIAQEFERYLRRRDAPGHGGPGHAGPAGDEPWPPKA
jgi:hypothetical protein